MPERLTVDFDHHDPEFHRDRLQRWEELRKCPVAYNPAYGGFWAVSSFDAVQQVARDEESFCSAYPDDPAGDITYIGITGIPRAEGCPGWAWRRRTRRCTRRSGALSTLW